MTGPDVMRATLLELVATVAALLVIAGAGIGFAVYADATQRRALERHYAATIAAAQDRADARAAR